MPCVDFFTMKLSATVTVLGLLPLALAESILVTFPSGTPDSVVDQAKQSVKDAVCDRVL